MRFEKSLARSFLYGIEGVLVVRMAEEVERWLLCEFRLEKPELEKFIADAIKARVLSPRRQRSLRRGLRRLMLDPPPEALSAEDESSLDEAEAQLERGEAQGLDDGVCGTSTEIFEFQVSHAGRVLH